MPRLSAEQVVFLATQVSAAILETAADRDHEDTVLMRAMRRWLPNRDEVDDATLRLVANTVRDNMIIHRSLLLNRLDRLVEQGRAAPL